MSLSGETIAVTGASGMIGAYICRELLSQGARVLGVVRNPQKAAFLKKDGVEFRKADLLDKASLVEAFKGADVVVSNAALYSITNFDWQENYQANKTGTANVYEATSEAGIKRIIQISTIGLYQFNLTDVIYEDSPQVDGENKEGGAYRATKQISESLAWQLADKLSLQMTSLRPSAVYGARDSNFMPACYFMMKLPILPMPSVTWPIVHAADVAQAVTGAITNDKSIGEAYNTSGDDLSFLEFFESFKRAAGRGPLLVPIPVPLKIRISNDKAKRELGFSNRSFERGLSEILAEEPDKL